MARKSRDSDSHSDDWIIFSHLGRKARTRCPEWEGRPGSLQCNRPAIIAGPKVNSKTA
jgi:hypothetical protein